MSLRMITETVNVVDYNDLNSFVKEITGQYYDCVNDEDWRNYSQHRIKVSGELDDYRLAKWNAFKVGRCKGFIITDILNGLCMEKHIPVGIYLIKVYW